MVLPIAVITAAPGIAVVVVKLIQLLEQIVLLLLQVVALLFQIGLLFFQLIEFLFAGIRPGLRVVYRLLNIRRVGRGGDLAQFFLQRADLGNKGIGHRLQQAVDGCQFRCQLCGFLLLLRMPLPRLEQAVSLAQFFRLFLLQLQRRPVPVLLDLRLQGGRLLLIHRGRHPASRRRKHVKGNVYQRRPGGNLYDLIGLVLAIDRPGHHFIESRRQAVNRPAGSPAVAAVLIPADGLPGAVAQPPVGKDGSGKGVGGDRRADFQGMRCFAEQAGQGTFPAQSRRRRRQGIAAACFQSGNAAIRIAAQRQADIFRQEEQIVPPAADHADARTGFPTGRRAKVSKPPDLAAAVIFPHRVTGFIQRLHLPDVPLRFLQRQCIGRINQEIQIRQRNL